MKRVPPSQRSLPFPPGDGELTNGSSTISNVPASSTAKVVELSAWKPRALQTAQSELIAAVCQRAAHLAEIVSSPSKPE